MLDKLEIKDWLKLNSQLQIKKNNLRKMLKEKGVLVRGGSNDFDHYKYFSEAQYKLLFTELFSECGLELKFTELEYTTFSGTDKQANGRMPKLLFTLTDIETGFYEETAITGEGIDKGDKAGYKAYTGAMKYYLANTFLVATGDDPEKESPDHRMNTRQERKASVKQIELIRKNYTAEQLSGILDKQGIQRLEDLGMKDASDLISALRKGGR